MKALIDAGVTYESVEQVAAGYCFGTPRPPIPPAHPSPSPRTAHPSPSPRTAYPLPSPRTAQPLPSPRTAYPPRLTLLADREHRRLDVRPARCLPARHAPDPRRERQQQLQVRSTRPGPLRPLMADVAAFAFAVRVPGGPQHRLDGVVHHPPGTAYLPDLAGARATVLTSSKRVRSTGDRGRPDRVRPGRRLREDVARPARRQGGLDRPRVAPPQDDAHDGEPAVGVLSDLKRFPRSDARLCLPCPVVCSTSSFQHDSGFDRKSPPNPQIFGNAGIEHMEKYGTTVDHFAKIGYKNHLHRY